MTDEHKSPAQVLVEERTGRDLTSLLRELYVAKRHSQDEIAQALTDQARFPIARSTISLWLRERGITRDERSAVAL